MKKNWGNKRRSDGDEDPHGWFPHRSSHGRVAAAGDTDGRTQGAFRDQPAMALLAQKWGMVAHSS